MPCLHFLPFLSKKIQNFTFHLIQKYVQNSIRIKSYSVNHPVFWKTTVVTVLPFLPPNVNDGVGIVCLCIKCVENMAISSVSVQLQEVIMNSPWEEWGHICNCYV